VNGHDPVQRRRLFCAQGIAALACFIVVHSAHAATAPAVKPACVTVPCAAQKTYGTSR
jgi:hypothetical protein